VAQTRRQSLFEACTNIAVGLITNFGAQLIIFPLLGVKTSVGQNLMIMVLFTGISLLRSYMLRRFFNWAHK
jgi:hypothetical protein